MSEDSGLSPVLKHPFSQTYSCLIAEVTNYCVYSVRILLSSPWPAYCRDFAILVCHQILYCRERFFVPGFSRLQYPAFCQLQKFECHLPFITPCKLYYIVAEKCFSFLPAATGFVLCCAVLHATLMGCIAAQHSSMSSDVTTRSVEAPCFSSMYASALR